MMTEMDDPMVWEMKEAVSETGVFKTPFVDSPASGAVEVTEQVVGMETSPPAPTLSSLGDDMSKHGDGAQSEAALQEKLALATEPSNVGIASELLIESSPFSAPNSGNFNDNAVEGTVVAQTNRRSRGKNWVKKDTDDLLKAVLNTNKACIRMEEGTASDSYWDVIAKAVPGRTGHECRGRMDTLKRSFSTTKNYCDEQRKEFKQLNEKDFGKLKVSPRLTEAWYNQIRKDCPPRPKKKLKTNGAGSSSGSTGFVPETSTLGLQPLVLPDGSAQGKPASVDPQAGQLERAVVDPLLHQAPPASPPWSDPEDLPEASSLELPVADPFQQQAPPAHTHWSDYIEDFPAIAFEPAVSAPLPCYDCLEDICETWSFDPDPTSFDT